MSTDTPILAYHFLANDRRLAHDRTRTAPITVGDTITVDGPVVLCERGLHGSRRLYDALNYAPGNILCRVLISGEVQEQDDKLAGASRTVIAMIDAESLLREWACDCAERALNRKREAGREPDPRSWEALAVARRFAKGEATSEELAAASAAAWDAAWDAEIEWQASALEQRALAAMGISADTREGVRA